MSDEDKRPTGPRPVPHLTLYITSVVLLMLSAGAAALSFAEPDLRGMQGAAVMFAVIATVLVATTMVVRRNDYCNELHRRQFDEVIENQAVLAYEMRRVIAHAENGLVVSQDIKAVMEEVDKRLDEDRHVAKAVGTLRERIDGLIAKYQAEFGKRLAELAEQQETLANMVADGTTVTLDVANSDVYELGKRVGRDEAMRERGKDQTP